MNGGVKNQTLSQGVKFVGLDKVTQHPIQLQTVKTEKLNLAMEVGYFLYFRKSGEPRNFIARSIFC